MYWVYVLWSKRLNKRYVGSTENLQVRLRAHNAGHGKFTKGGVPREIVRTERFETKREARKRENSLKSGAGRSWLDQELPDFYR